MRLLTRAFFTQASALPASATSFIPTPAQPELTSMAVQISAARAQNEINRISNVKFSGEDVKKRLIALRDAIGSKSFCGPCWIHGHEFNHPDSSCSGAASGWTWPGSAYKSWKAHVNFPTYHCYNCGLPQVNELFLTTHTAGN